MVQSFGVRLCIDSEMISPEFNFQLMKMAYEKRLEEGGEIAVAGFRNNV